MIGSSFAHLLHLLKRDNLHLYHLVPSIAPPIFNLCKGQINQNNCKHLRGCAGPFSARDDPLRRPLLFFFIYSIIWKSCNGYFVLLNRPFSQQTFWLVIEGKAQVLQITLTITLFYSRVPVSHNSVTVSHNERHQDLETNAVKQNLTIIYLHLLWHVKIPSVKKGQLIFCLYLSMMKSYYHVTS